MPVCFPHIIFFFIRIHKSQDLNISQGIAISGSRVYVAASGAGLHIVDVNIPERPRIVRTIDTPGFAVDVIINGDLAYVADASNGKEGIYETNKAHASHKKCRRIEPFKFQNNWRTLKWLKRQQV